MPAKASTIFLTRQVPFCAGHIYKGGGMNEAELKELFGIAAEPSGHGHNYVLEVIFEGPIDPRTGMVINIKELDKHLRVMLKPIDHRMLNVSMPEFEHTVPTTEKLAQALWHRLPEKIGPCWPVSLRLEEHPGMYVELEGKDPDMVYLTRAIEFAASHRLDSPHLTPEENCKIFGKCNNFHGHGHNYVAEVTLAGKPDDRTGVIANLGIFEKILKDEIDERFDHKHLNLDTDYFNDRIATGENIAIVIWELIEKRIQEVKVATDVKLHRVRLIETPRSWFDYYGD